MTPLDLASNKKKHSKNAEKVAPIGVAAPKTLLANGTPPETLPYIPINRAPRTANKSYNEYDLRR